MRAMFNASLSILSGPEGGFSPTEVEQATASNYVSIELGPRVLRTETAAIAAISACQTLWGDMG
jgi:16S rRNA (uracil1498-N3)-methyltransferase